MQGQLAPNATVVPLLSRLTPRNTRETILFAPAAYHGWVNKSQQGGLDALQWHKSKDVERRAAFGQWLDEKKLYDVDHPFNPRRDPPHVNAEFCQIWVVSGVYE